MSPKRDEAIARREGWDRAAAGWGRRWPVFEAGARSLSDFMVARAAVGAGHRVLDLATGVGEPAVTAARGVGSSGEVVAVDQAAAMLALARRRAVEHGLGNIAFVQASAVDFEPPPASFDVVLSRWGLMLIPEPGKVLAVMRRALAPGGRLVVAVWSRPERVPLLALLQDTLAEVFAVPPTPPGEPGAFALDDPERLEDLVRQAGFHEVRVESHDCVFRFSSPAAYRQFEEDVSVSLAVAVEESPGLVEPFRRAIEARAARHAAADGTVALSNEALVVSARRPRD